MGYTRCFGRSPGAPSFLEASPAGWFKGRDPPVPIEMLTARWVEGTPLMYFGRARKSPHLPTRSGLRHRVGLLVQFGAGKPVRHWGGRLIWQVESSHDFVVGWRRLPEEASPSAVEADLLQEFERAYGRLPFGNLRRGDRRESGGY